MANGVAIAHEISFSAYASCVARLLMVNFRPDACAVLS